MDIEIYPVGRVTGSRSSDDGSFIDVACQWEDGENFMLRLRLPEANAMQIAVQDAASDAALRGGNKVAPPIAEGLLLQASHVPEYDILTVRLEGGMQLQFLVPAHDFDNGIFRAPDV